MWWDATLSDKKLDYKFPELFYPFYFSTHNAFVHWTMLPLILLMVPAHFHDVDLSDHNVGKYLNYP